MRQAAAAAVLLDLLGDRRVGVERLEQLHQVRSVADLQQHLAHLVGAEHVLAVQLR